MQPKLLEGAAVDDTVGVVTSAREQSLARKVAAGTEPSFERREGLVIAKLKRLMEQCRLANTVVGEAAFETISDAYRDEVNAIDPLVKTADAQMTNAIKFIEEAWGNGREMLVAIAELTTRQTTTQFIAHYGNEEYYAHNDELQVDEHRRSSSERVRTLDINAEEAMQPGETKAAGAQTIAEYYGGKQFEYGFASMSKMTLPDAARLKGKTVLDVACRRGKGCFKFSAKVGGAGHVIGVDWSPSYIEGGHRRIPEKAWRKNGLKANNMSFKVAYPEDLMQAGIGEGTVDVVYINNVDDPALRSGQGTRGVLARAQAGRSAHLRDDRLGCHQGRGGGPEGARHRQQYPGGASRRRAARADEGGRVQGRRGHRLVSGRSRSRLHLEHGGRDRSLDRDGPFRGNRPQRPQMRQ